MAREQPPRAAVIATAAVVVLMGLSTALSAEAWPLGPWELFSRSRKPVQTSYIAKFVEGGRETQVDFGSLPYAFSGANAVLGGFLDLPGPDQEAVCEAWATALEEIGEEPEQIRIYRVERRLNLRGRPPERQEHRVHECERRE